MSYLTLDIFHMNDVSIYAILLKRSTVKQSGNLLHYRHTADDA